jgi:hypothetical protein
MHFDCQQQTSLMTRSNMTLLESHGGVMLKQLEETASAETILLTAVNNGMTVNTTSSTVQIHFWGKQQLN